MVMDLAFFEQHSPVPSEPWARSVTGLTRRLFRRAGLEVVIEGRERLGQTPCLLALNATHQYDLVPIRYAFRVAGHDVVTLSKGKNYHGLAMRTFSVKLGSVPLVSRGYIIVMDFLALHGRKPDEQEYRALRDLLDAGTPLPSRPTLDAVATRPRSMLGRPFAPAREPYRDAALALYREMMDRTLAHCRAAMSRGHDVQIFPQGSSSTRLSEGHIGAVQLAHALGVPVLPVGVSGCLTVLPKHRSIRMAPGRVTMRVGEAFRPDLTGLPAGFTAFDPGDERAAAPVLRRATDDLMERINLLLDPAYRWAEDRQSDGAVGVRRFA